jgi:hypothetical protein
MARLLVSVLILLDRTVKLLALETTIPRLGWPLAVKESRDITRDAFRRRVRGRQRGGPIAPWFGSESGSCFR